MEKQLPETLLEPEVIAEMVLKRALEDYRKAQIEKQIDDSLKNRNKVEFFRLTNELKRTHKLKAKPEINKKR
ncbi:IDEAL domain-containing protein [Bacillus sp. ISL-4]|uniref:IDEAL domain-containing protein n=1 Tax=Bacillus sp. ISL-4 TaxID=2819125 RepID=UPI001BEC0B3A|nr:IDEAL domain-containing protein [Bacillus sp. ISL-4]MBT2667241.1 IDEAL domain-containing protein [Bacillus sp. ISL-4]